MTVETCKVLLANESVSENTMARPFKLNTSWAVLFCASVYYTVLLNVLVMFSFSLQCTSWFQLLSLWTKSYGVTIKWNWPLLHYFEFFKLFYKLKFGFSHITFRSKRVWKNYFITLLTAVPLSCCVSLCPFLCCLIMFLSIVYILSSNAAD